MRHHEEWLLGAERSGRCARFGDEVMSVICAETADQAWLSVAQCFRSSAAASIEESRNGPTRELLHAQIVIGDPRQRWVVSRIPSINPAFAIVESIWVLAGREDAGFLVPWNAQLTSYAGTGEVFCGAYGKRLRSAFGIDQLQRAYEGLRANPSSRQFVLQIWDPRRDFPYPDGRPQNPDIPCNVCSLLKIRNNKLEWLQILRSNDVFLGFPYDVVQFTTLQEVLAGWLGLGVGTYVHIADSLHIYERDLERVMSASACAAPRNTDILAVSRNKFAELLPQLCRTIEQLADPVLLPGGSIPIIEALRVPLAYANLMFVIAAESARRRRASVECETAISRCKNPLLVTLWRNWARRCAQ
jgi:thymidylate synthase